MRERTYTVIIVNGDTSASRTFKVSSKLVRNSIIASFVLLVFFGFLIFNYLARSFDKEKMKRLQNRIIELENVIDILEKEKKNSFLSKEDDLNKKLILLNELDKSLKSIRKDISVNKESIKKKISLNKELTYSQKKLESIKDEIKKSKPLLDLTRKQVQIVAKETRKEIDKSYIEKLPLEIILAIFASFIGGFLSGRILTLITLKNSTLEDKKEKEK